jgi:anti-sigma regulatory factor (Ser/Thr protein kinase)
MIEILSGSKSTDESSNYSAAPPIFLKATNQAPLLARRFVAEWFRKWDIPDDYLTRVVVSELVTNSYRYGSGDVIIVRLSLDARDGLPVVEVWDQGDGIPAVRPENYAATSGRGLLTIEALAIEWGVRRPREGGKVTWARMDL